MQPEATPIKETQRATGELAKLDIHTHQIIINGILPPEEASNPFFAQRVAMQNRYLDQIARELPLPARRMFLLDGEIKGVARLRQVAEMLLDGKPRPQTQALARPQRQKTRLALSQADILPRVEPNGHQRVIFFAGKGGVGKTSASCVTAVWLARQGHKTLLLTTDPAAHLGDVLGVPVGDEAQTCRWRAEPVGRQD